VADLQKTTAFGSKLRVLHVDSTLDSGGIATSLWHLLPAQRQPQGATLFEVAVAVLYEVGLYGRLLISDGIPVHHIRFGHKYSPHGFWRLFWLLQRGRYDVVHAHGWPAVFFVALISLLDHRPRYVMSEHNVTNRRRRLGLKFLDRLIYWRFDAISAVSQAAAAALVAWLPQTREKVCVVHNGLDVSRLFSQTGLEPTGHLDLGQPESQDETTRNKSRQELGLPDAGPLVFAAGSLEHRKGIDILLQALALMKSSLPMTVIAGDGPLRPDLEALAFELGIMAQVRFLGFRPDLLKIMAAADLFVLSSRWEGCPMVVLEAMALGKPIVATAVGGVPELIVDSLSGRLVPPESPEALSAAIQQMLANPDDLMQMGSQARQRLLTCFQVERSAQQMSRIYLGKTGGTDINAGWKDSGGC
jgi:glycosyltransferase involved in cell wall biosynthesis